MATNQLSLLRQWHMLRLVPRAPAKITVQDIRARLASADFEVTERTVQRDLNELAQVFPLTVDERNKPYGWSWHKDAPNFDLPGLSIPEALTLTLVEQHLQHQLPPSTTDSLQAYFKSARQTLANVQTSAHAKAWLNKVRSIAPMLALLPPSINEESQCVVYEALMQDRQLSLVYQKRGAKSKTIYDIVHPLALVQRGQLLYLVCLFADFKDLRYLAIHRILSAEMLFEPARKPRNFSIDAYLNSGAMGFSIGDEIRLEAIFSRHAGEHLYETPLHRKQTLEQLADGRLRLVATIPNTKELQWWLLGLGDGVEVIAPAALRQQMKETIQRMALAYQSPSLNTVHANRQERNCAD